MWPYLPNPDGNLPTYYVLTSLAFTLAIIWAAARAKKRNFNVNQVLDLGLVIMVSSFIGARLFHVLFEQPQFFIQNPIYIFKFWYGGFVFYGGFITAVISVFIFKKIRPFDLYKHADLLAPVFAFAYGLGRLGCFAAGCCFGKPTNLPWGVVFPSFSEAPSGIALHPTQLYATAWEWFAVAILLTLEKRAKTLKKGAIFGVWLTLHGFGRVMMEWFRDDFRGQNVFNLSISTWISFGLIAWGISLIKQNGAGQSASTSI